MSKSIEAIREAPFDAELLGYIAEAFATYDSYKPLNARKAAAAIRNCIKAHDAALSRASEVEAQTIERCAKVCEDEATDAASWDVRRELSYCAAAIRSMRPTGDSGVAAEADTRAYSEDGFDLTPTKSKD